MGKLIVKNIGMLATPEGKTSSSTGIPFSFIMGT